MSWIGFAVLACFVLVALRHRRGWDHPHRFEAGGPRWGRRRADPGVRVRAGFAGRGDLAP